MAIPLTDRPIGSTLLVLVRPERIRVLSPADAGEQVPNRTAARIADMTYLGEGVHLKVQSNDGEEFLVSLKSDRYSRDLRPGDAVDLAIDPEDLHVLQN